VLLLGMVYSNEKDPITGQMFRDRVRCEAMERLGYVVKTLDDKHDGDLERSESSIEEYDEIKKFAKKGTHVRANFANCRRMLKSMIDSWGMNQVFDQIILDYFFCPAGYVNMRWAEGFFRDTLPAFAANGMIAEDGSIWLPHAYYVEQMLEKYDSELSPYFSWNLVKDFEKCPLFEATEHVEDQLKKCPDRRTNSNQITPLLEVSEHIFYEMKLRREPMTPSKAGKKRKDMITEAGPSKIMILKKSKKRLATELTDE